MTQPISGSPADTDGERKRRPAIRWTQKSPTLFVVEGKGFDRTWRVSYSDGSHLREGWYWFWYHTSWNDEPEGPYKTATAAKRAKVRHDG